jgi:hypothetical protein
LQSDVSGTIVNLAFLPTLNRLSMDVDPMVEI